MHLNVTGPSGAPTILFLHAAGTSAWMWRPIAARLELFHCLIPDLPGHGQSAGVPWHSLDDTADQLADLIGRHANAGRAHIVGLSLGAYVALRLVTRHPERCNHIVLSGVNVLPFPHPTLMRLAGCLMLPLMKRDFMVRAQAKALRIPEDQIDEYRFAAKAMSLRAFLRIGNELMTFRAEQDLKRLDHPALVLAGEREQGLIRRSVPELLKALPNAQGYLVPGVGHGWSGEAPDLFARVLQAWFMGQQMPNVMQRVSI